MALSANLLFLVASVHAAARVELGRPLGDVPGWTRGARSSGGENVTLHVFMRHSTEGVAALERRLREVSEPSSAAYGRYVRSLAELEALSPIADEQLALALRHFGPLADAVEPNPNRDILKVHTSAARAERLFGSAFHHFSHANGATALRASAACSLPSEVAGAVWAVSGLLELPILKESNPSLPELRRPSMDEPVPVPGAWPNTCGDECAGLITPGVLHYAYGVPNSTVGMETDGNSMSVAAFMKDEHYLQSDLDAFGSSCHINATVDVDIGGGESTSQAGGETAMDLQIIEGLSPGVPLTFIYTEKLDFGAWLSTLSGLQAPPLVNSISYCLEEKKQSDSLVQAVNTQLMKAGLRGLSLLFASGDHGVCGRADGCGLFSIRYQPMYPASSPYATAVGGTLFNTIDGVGPSVAAGETTWPTSGGGFSDKFDRPSWQAAAVGAYLNDSAADLPKSKYFHAAGRAFPDVSAHSGSLTPYCLRLSGKTFQGEGTSAATPAVAAIFARLNGLRLKAGKPPLGFANPWIYANASDAFNDITTGNNGGEQKRAGGFKAIAGWDPATGWGTPSWAKLVGRV